MPAIPEDQSASEVAWFVERTKRTTVKRQRLAQPDVHKITTATKKWGPGNAYKNTKTGYRPDLGIVCRSGWEANVCRVIQNLDIPYEFEPEIFHFPIKRGNKAYTPDIYLPKTEEWIEVKGYFDKASQIKMRRFKKYYPQDWANLTMIVGKTNVPLCQALGVPNILVYEEIRRLWKSKILNWEGQ